MFLTVWGVGENSDRAEHDDTMNVRNVTPATPLPQRHIEASHKETAGQNNLEIVSAYITQATWQSFCAYP